MLRRNIPVRALNHVRLVAEQAILSFFEGRVQHPMVFRVRVLNLVSLATFYFLISTWPLAWSAQVGKNAHGGSSSFFWRVAAP